MTTTETTVTLPPETPTAATQTETVEYDEQPGPFGKAAISLGVIGLVIVIAAIVVSALAFAGIFKASNAPTPYLLAQNNTQINIPPGDTASQADLSSLPLQQFIPGSDANNPPFSYDPATWSAKLTAVGNYNVTMYSKYATQIDTLTTPPAIALEMWVDGEKLEPSDQRVYSYSISLTGSVSRNINVSSASEPKKVTLNINNGTGVQQGMTTLQMTITKTS